LKELSHGPRFTDKNDSLLAWNLDGLDHKKEAVTRILLKVMLNTEKTTVLPDKEG
jgi:hypothetical protein